MRVILIITLCLLSGCAALKEKKTAEPKQKVKYLIPSNFEKPEKIELPTPPVPVKPGLSQYLPIEEFEPAPVSKNPEEAIKKAQEDSTETATDEKFVNSITQYTYQEGLIYQIYCSPATITDIMFEPGEEFKDKDVGSGDTKRWKPPKLSKSGSGDNRRIHLFLKPKRPGLHTNMVVATSKRVYHFDLRSYRNLYQTSVSFEYPADRYREETEELLSEYQQKSNKINGIDLENANFDYEIIGNARFRPVRCFDDGSKTYIAFPDDIDQTELPPLFIVSSENKNKIELVDYRYHAKYYIVDSIFEAAVLKMGEKRPHEVFIYNRKLSRNGRNVNIAKKRFIHTK